MRMLQNLKYHKYGTHFNVWRILRNSIPRCGEKSHFRKAMSIFVVYKFLQAIIIQLITRHINSFTGIALQQWAIWLLPLHQNDDAEMIMEFSGRLCPCAVKEW
jgi:hypothetical protein